MKPARAAAPLVFVIVIGIGSVSALVGGCPSSDRGEHDPAVFAAATDLLDARLAAVRDFRIEGSARDVATGTTLPITYAFMQPQFARGTLGAQQTVVFDGRSILALDHSSRTYARVARDVGDERFLMALHSAFGEFACEGWRPPLLKARGTRATASQGQLHLTVAIDDADLAEEQIVLRAADGAFVSKRTLDKAGKVVAATEVLEELDDAATGLRLPKKWRKTVPAGIIEVTLDKATVNSGLREEDFATTVPEGYKPGT